MNCPVVCEKVNGKSYRLSRRDAEVKVQNGQAERIHNRLIREVPSGDLRARGLSARVGETLATAVYRRESWALTMLSDIRKSRAVTGGRGT